MTNREIHLPHAETPPDLTEIYEDAISRLPLETCHSERHELTGYLEFIAPPGKMFTISGEFMVWIESNDDATRFGAPPEESRALQAKYRNRKDRDYGYDSKWDWYKPRRTFSGKRLSVSVGDARLGEVVPRTFRYGPQNVQVRVAGPIEAEAEDGTREFPWEVVPGSNIFRPGFYDSPLSYIYWYYEEAQADLRNSRVQLVPDNLPERELKIIEDSPSRQTLWTPLEVDSERYFGFLEKNLLPEGATYSPESKLQEMRRKRLEGMPFGDDPLRHLQIVQENRDGQVAGLAWLASELENLRQNGPKNFKDARRIQDEKTAERWRRERADKLRGTIAIITNNGPLYQIVGELAQPDWLEKELGPNKDVVF